MRMLSLFAGLVLPFACAGLASAQPPSATLRGRVLDGQERPIAGATVTVDDRATGATRRVTTGTAGEFAVLALPPGTASVAVNAEGFSPASRAGIVLETGQVVSIDIEMSPASLREAVTVKAAALEIDTSRSVVDAVMPSSFIEALPLNGRNFLELALLVPGNAPAPNFDPTKANTVVISSAGQLGRGGNITIDGADNNDDVVGGPLQNVTEEAVQEFQIATNRFTAESGRSASSIINVVTKSGTDHLRGTWSVLARSSRLQALPATYDRALGGRPPFDREQYAGAVGGPLSRQKAFWFGAFEHRNQDGAVLVGSRDLASRVIRRSFAPAPLDDLLGSARFDYRPGAANSVMVRYAGQWEDDTGASTLDRALGSASQRQESRNHYQSAVGSWTRIFSSTLLNLATASLSTFHNDIAPVAVGPQLTFPSLQDGSSFRVPQATAQRRFQLSDSVTAARGAHVIRAGGEWQRVDAGFDLGVFQQGRIEFVEDFPTFDHNGDGRVDDNDLLFAVTLRSGKPDQALTIPDADNNHLAAFVQDDWRVRPDLTLNLGLRYEIDTDVKNIRRVGGINPLVAPFLHGTRRRDANNFGPRAGFNWAPGSGRTSVHGGYGIYYDRITLEIESLERGLDGRALPIEVRAGNVFFVDRATGQVPPFAPSFGNPFTGFVLTGAGASGINIIDNRLQNPTVQQFNLGVQRALPHSVVLRVDGLHNLGTHFIIGRTVGAVFNPVVGGPDRVVNLESSVNTHYDALLVSAEKRAGRYGFRASYTLSKAFNYANDDQIPFSNGPIDPHDLRREYGPTPNDQRHRFTVAAWTDAPGGLLVASIWTVASAVPMDVLMPDAQSRVPVFQRNAGARLFRTGADLNRALQSVDAAGGIDGTPLPLVDDGVRFGDTFNSLDVRVSRPFAWRRARIEPMLEMFNVFNVTNILGTSVRNYSGYANVLVRDDNDPGRPGYLRSSSFGQPLTTAGGVFGSGGPRAVQLALRARF